MPAAYVVTRTGFDARPPRRGLGEVLAPVRAASKSVVELAVGLWPVWAIYLLGMLLVWLTAMQDSP